MIIIHTHFKFSWNTAFDQKVYGRHMTFSECQLVGVIQQLNKEPPCDMDRRNGVTIDTRGYRHPSPRPWPAVFVAIIEVVDDKNSPLKLFHIMYVCMVITYRRVYINRVRLPILLVFS